MVFVETTFKSGLRTRTRQRVLFPEQGPIVPIVMRGLCKDSLRDQVADILLRVLQYMRRVKEEETADYCNVHVFLLCESKPSNADSCMRYT